MVYRVTNHWPEHVILLCIGFSSQKCGHLSVNFDGTGLGILWA